MFFLGRRGRGRGPGEHPLPVSGNSCRGALPRINHNRTSYLIMRVSAPSRTTLATAPAAARRAPGGSFSLGETGATPPQSAAMALRTLGGIDALIALQGVEDPVERRRRAVKHGRRALDALDELKLGLLSGMLEPAALLRLKAVASDLKDGSGDEQLDQVLAEIE